MKKSAYVCGPLTDLAPVLRDRTKQFYVDIANLCEQVLGVRAFVPHEYEDPIDHPADTPQQVDAIERKQVCELTSVLIAVAIAPSWGGGIEVEMAHRSGVPVVILCTKEMLEARKVSRLLRGNPGVVEVISYDIEDDALTQLEIILPRVVS